MKIGSTPSAELVLAPFDAKQFPAFSNSANEQPIPLGPIPRSGESFVLINGSSRAIVAITVLWQFIGEDGRQHPHTQRTDSFSVAKFVPVLPSGSKLLIAPGAFLPEWAAASPHTGVFGLSHQSRVYVEANLDCVIFEDGELIGPNKSHCDAEIQSRKIAAEEVVKQIYGAQERGDALEPILREMLQKVPDQSDRVGLWLNQFASQLLRVKSRSEARFFDGHLRWLESLPTPPKFFRSNNHS